MTSLYITPTHGIYKALLNLENNITTIPTPITYEYPSMKATIQIDYDDGLIFKIWHPERPLNICEISSTKNDTFNVKINASDELAFYLSSDLLNAINFVNHSITKPNKPSRSKRRSTKQTKIQTELEL